MIYKKIRQKNRKRPKLGRFSHKILVKTMKVSKYISKKDNKRLGKTNPRIVGRTVAKKAVGNKERLRKMKKMGKMGILRRMSKMGLMRGNSEKGIDAIEYY